MKQIARNLTDCCDDFLLATRYLIMERDGSFSAAFRAILQSAGVEPVRLPPRSPNLDAWLERFHLSIQTECLDRMIFFGETILRNAIREYLAHHRSESNHQGLDNQIPEPSEDVGTVAGTIHRNERLGGLLNYYHRKVT